MNTGLDALKTASKKTVRKSAKTAGEFIGNKIADALAKLIDNKIVKKTIWNWWKFKKCWRIIPPELREEKIHKLRQIL